MSSKAKRVVSSDQIADNFDHQEGAGQKARSGSGGGGGGLTGRVKQALARRKATGEAELLPRFTTAPAYYGSAFRAADMHNVAKAQLKFAITKRMQYYGEVVDLKREESFGTSLAAFFRNTMEIKESYSTTKLITNLVSELTMDGKGKALGFAVAVGAGIVTRVRQEKKAAEFQRQLKAALNVLYFAEAISIIIEALYPSENDRRSFNDFLCDFLLFRFGTYFLLNAEALATPSPNHGGDHRKGHVVAVRKFEAIVDYVFSALEHADRGLLTDDLLKSLGSHTGVAGAVTQGTRAVGGGGSDTGGTIESMCSLLRQLLDTDYRRKSNTLNLKTRYTVYLALQNGICPAIADAEANADVRATLRSRGEKIVVSVHTGKPVEDEVHNVCSKQCPKLLFYDAHGDGAHRSVVQEVKATKFTHLQPLLHLGSFDGDVELSDEHNLAISAQTDSMVPCAEACLALGVWQHESLKEFASRAFFSKRESRSKLSLRQESHSAVFLSSGVLPITFLSAGRGADEGGGESLLRRASFEFTASSDAVPPENMVLFASESPLDDPFNFAEIRKEMSIHVPCVEFFVPPNASLSPPDAPPYTPPTPGRKRADSKSLSLEVHWKPLHNELGQEDLEYIAKHLAIVNFAVPPCLANDKHNFLVTFSSAFLERGGFYKSDAPLEVPLLALKRKVTVNRWVKAEAEYAKSHPSKEYYLRGFFTSDTSHMFTLHLEYWRWFNGTLVSDETRQRPLNTRNLLHETDNRPLMFCAASFSEFHQYLRRVAEDRRLDLSRAHSTASPWYCDEQCMPFACLRLANQALEAQCRDRALIEFKRHFTIFETESRQLVKHVPLQERCLRPLREAIVEYAARKVMGKVAGAFSGAVALWFSSSESQSDALTVTVDLAVQRGVERVQKADRERQMVKMRRAANFIIFLETFKWFLIDVQDGGRAYGDRRLSERVSEIVFDALWLRFGNYWMANVCLEKDTRRNQGDIKDAEKRLLKLFFLLLAVQISAVSVYQANSDSEEGVAVDATAAGRDRGVASSFSSAKAEEPPNLSPAGVATAAAANSGPSANVTFNFAQFRRIFMSVYDINASKNSQRRVSQLKASFSNILLAQEFCNNALHLLLHISDSDAALTDGVYWESIKREFDVLMASNSRVFYVNHHQKSDKELKKFVGSSNVKISLYDMLFCAPRLIIYDCPSHSVKQCDAPYNAQIGFVPATCEKLNNVPTSLYLGVPNDVLRSAIVPVGFKHCESIYAQTDQFKDDFNMEIYGLSLSSMCITDNNNNDNNNNINDYNDNNNNSNNNDYGEEIDVEILDDKFSDGSELDDEGVNGDDSNNGNSNYYNSNSLNSNVGQSNSDNFVSSVVRDMFDGCTYRPKGNLFSAANLKAALIDVNNTRTDLPVWDCSTFGRNQQPCPFYVDNLLHPPAVMTNLQRLLEGDMVMFASPFFVEQPLQHPVREAHALRVPCFENGKLCWYPWHQDAGADTHKTVLLNAAVVRLLRTNPHSKSVAFLFESQRQLQISPDGVSGVHAALYVKLLHTTNLPKLPFINTLQLDYEATFKNLTGSQYQFVCTADERKGWSYQIATVSGEKKLSFKLLGIKCKKEDSQKPLRFQFLSMNAFKQLCKLRTRSASAAKR